MTSNATTADVMTTQETEPRVRVSPFLNTPQQRKEERARLIGASLRKLRSLDRSDEHLRRFVLVSNFLGALRRDAIASTPVITVAVRNSHDAQSLSSDVNISSGAAAAPVRDGSSPRTSGGLRRSFSFAFGPYATAPAHCSSSSWPSSPVIPVLPPYPSEHQQRFVSSACLVASYLPAAYRQSQSPVGLYTSSYGYFPATHHSNNCDQQSMQPDCKRRLTDDDYPVSQSSLEVGAACKINTAASADNGVNVNQKCIRSITEESCSSRDNDSCNEQQQQQPQSNDSQANQSEGSSKQLFLLDNWLANGSFTSECHASLSSNSRFAGTEAQSSVADQCSGTCKMPVTQCKGSNSFYNETAIATTTTCWNSTQQTINFDSTLMDYVTSDNLLTGLSCNGRNRSIFGHHAQLPDICEHEQSRLVSQSTGQQPLASRSLFPLLSNYNVLPQHQQQLASTSNSPIIDFARSGLLPHHQQQTSTTYRAKCDTIALNQSLASDTENLLDASDDSDDDEGTVDDATEIEDDADMVTRQNLGDANKLMAAEHSSLHDSSFSDNNTQTSSLSNLGAPNASNIVSSEREQNKDIINDNVCGSTDVAGGWCEKSQQDCVSTDSQPQSCVSCRINDDFMHDDANENSEAAKNENATAPIEPIGSTDLNDSCCGQQSQLVSGSSACYVCHHQSYVSPLHLSSASEARLLLPTEMPCN